MLIKIYEAGIQGERIMIYEEILYGFKYGAVEVTRLTSDDKKGWVVLGVKTPKTEIQIYVTKTGKVRIHEDGKEWISDELTKELSKNKLRNDVEV
jgi:hypothetical protein